MKLNMRKSVRYIAYRDQHPLQEHFDEAFAALSRYVRADDMQLVFKGYDMGGPIWVVESA